MPDNIEEESRGRGRPPKDTIEVDLKKSVKEVGDANKVAAMLLAQGMPREEVAQRLRVDPRVIDKLEVIVQPIKAVMSSGPGDNEGYSVEGREEPPVVPPFVDYNDYAVERMQNLIKLASTKEGANKVAGELVKTELELKRVNDLMGRQGMGGANMDTGGGLINAAEIKEMMRNQLQLKIAKEMIRDISFGSDREHSDPQKDAEIQLLRRELDTLKEKREMERLLDPIKADLAALIKNPKADEIPAALTQKLSQFEQMFQKYDMDKKQHDMLAEFTKAVSKGEDPMKYMKEVEEIKAKAGAENRQLELQLQAQREEMIKQELIRLQDNLLRKIEDLENRQRSGGNFSVNDIKGLSETVKVIKEVSKELGGGEPGEKPSLADKVIEQAIGSFGQTLPEVVKAYRETQKNKSQYSQQMPQNQQQYPDQIILSPNEVDLLMENRRRENEAKKKSSPQMTNSPQMQFPSPPISRRIPPLDKPTLPQENPQPSPVEKPPVVEVNPNSNVSVDLLINPVASGTENLWDMENSSSSISEEPEKDIKPNAPITKQETSPAPQEPPKRRGGKTKKS